MNETAILEQLYEKVVALQKTKSKPQYPAILTASVDTLIDEIDKNKSLFSAMITSFVKKIAEPQQDIRYHRTDFPQGYSARSLDTSVVSPFFKQHFPKRTRSR